MRELKEKFSAAITFVFAQNKIVQSDFAGKIGISETSLSDYKTGRKEGREQTRRAIADELGFPYETLLCVGDLILSGLSGEEALERARGMAAGNYVLPKLQIKGTARVVQNCAGNVVNNGVMSVGDAPVSDSGPRDEIRAEIEDWLAESFGEMSTSRKIAAREAIRQHVPEFAAYVQQREHKGKDTEGGSDGSDAML